MKTVRRCSSWLFVLAVFLSLTFTHGIGLAQDEIPACQEDGQGVVYSIDPETNTAILQLDDGSQCSVSLDSVRVQPVAALLSLYYQVPLLEINTYHQQGIGFGVLVKLYALAKASSESETPLNVADLVAQFKGGMGIGQLFQTYGKPGETGVGQVVKQNKNNNGNSSHTPPGQSNKNKVKNNVKNKAPKNSNLHGKSPKFTQPTPTPAP